MGNASDLAVILIGCSIIMSAGGSDHPEKTGQADDTVVSASCDDAAASWSPTRSSATLLARQRPYIPRPTQSSTQQAMVLPHHAVVYHGHEPSRGGALGGFRMAGAVLHPDDFGALADGSLDDGRNRLRFPEYLDEFDRARYGLEFRIRFLPQDFGFVRIHRDDPVPVGLQISTDGETRPVRLGRKAHRDDGPVFREHVFDFLIGHTLLKLISL